MENKNAVIYARFSSSGQREESIEGQVRECRAYAVRMGYNVIGEYADKAMTGTNDRRPDFQRMVHDSAKGYFDTVICWKHDRFARNRYDAALYKAKLKANGVQIAYAMESVPEGAQGIIIDSIMEGYAEYYSANLSENVKRGLYDSALKRLVMGQVCYGLVPGPDGRFAIQEEQAAVVRRIYTEYANGKSSRVLIDELNGEGLRTRFGRKWSYNSIVQMIKNPKYKGVYEYADIYDENGIPAIVSKELWAKANEQVARHHRAPHAKDDYLLTGKLYCGHCGEAMVSTGGVGRTGKYYKYYKCNGTIRKDCKKKNVSKDYIEDVVFTHIIDIIQSDAIIDLFADRFMEWQSKQEENGAVYCLERRLKETETAIGNIVATIEKGLVVESLTSRLKELEEQKKQIEKQIGEELVSNPSLSRDDVVGFLKSFRNGDADSPRWKRWLIDTFVSRIYLYDDGRLTIQLNYTGSCNAVELNVLDNLVSNSAQCSLPKYAKSNIYFVEENVFISLYI